jgi:hypothetical protein
MFISCDDAYFRLGVPLTQYAFSFTSLFVRTQTTTATTTMTKKALKAKLLALGVDLNKYPELTEKEDLIKLYEIRGREKAIQNKKALDAKQKGAEAKAKQRELLQDKQRKMALRVQELEAQVSYIGHGMSCYSNRTRAHSPLMTCMRLGCTMGAI